MDWGSITENSLRATFGQEAVIYALAAIGLNLHFGYTGLLNFGQVAFMAVGAYAVGISVSFFGWSTAPSRTTPPGGHAPWSSTEHACSTASR